MSENDNGADRTIDLNKLDLNNLYSAHYTADFTYDNQEALGLVIPVNVFLQDPYVAEDFPELGLNHGTFK